MCLAVAQNHKTSKINLPMPNMRKISSTPSFAAYWFHSNRKFQYYVPSTVQSISIYPFILANASLHFRLDVVKTDVKLSRQPCSKVLRQTLEVAGPAETKMQRSSLLFGHAGPENHVTLVEVRMVRIIPGR